LKLSNDQVPASRAILIHSGNDAGDTEGCLLAGSTRSKDFVGDSKTKLTQINNYVKLKGIKGAKIIITANMNKIFILILLFISCNNIAHTKTNPGTLKKAYLAKDEKVFLENFPGKFKDFKAIFGWDDKVNGPNPLYTGANEYVDYFFQLASQEKYVSYKNKIVDIALNGIWEADAVGYFQVKLHDITETDKDFVLLLKKLKKKDADSFWRFYFDKEQSIYSPKLESVLDESMKAQSMLVFKKIQGERRIENTTDHVLVDYEIFDKDGYSNLRKEKNATSAVIEEVKNGESVLVLNRTGDWWYIQTKSEKKGYIHKSRIRIKKAGNVARSNAVDINKPSVQCVFKDLSSKFNFKITATKFRDGGKIPSELTISISDKKNTSQRSDVIFKPEYWIRNNCSSTSYLNKALINEGIEKYNKFIVADYNFDGLEDFAIVNYEGSNAGPQYAFFFQDNKGQFKKDDAFPLQGSFFPKNIDFKNRTLTICGPVGCCKISTTVYQLKANRQWKMISSSKKKM
jgi:hypothetical protein